MKYRSAETSGHGYLRLPANMQVVVPFVFLQICLDKAKIFSFLCCVESSEHLCQIFGSRPQLSGTRWGHLREHRTREFSWNDMPLRVVTAPDCFVSSSLAVHTRTRFGVEQVFDSVHAPVEDIDKAIALGLHAPARTGSALNSDLIRQQ